MERRTLLEKTVIENERLSISRYIETNGVAFYHLVASQELEGIVAKRKTSLYHPGKRTKDWIKIKNLKDNDFVVCGYIPKDNNMTSLILGQYHDGGDTCLSGARNVGRHAEQVCKIYRRENVHLPKCRTATKVPYGLHRSAFAPYGIWTVQHQVICVSRCFTSGVMTNCRRNA